MRLRAFWVSPENQADIHWLEQALVAGQQIKHFGVTTGGVLVITDGWVPAPANSYVIRIILW